MRPQRVRICALDTSCELLARPMGLRVARSATNLQSGSALSGLVRLPARGKGRASRACLICEGRHSVAGHKARQLPASTGAPGAGTCIRSLVLLSAAARPQGLEMVSQPVRWAARVGTSLVALFTLLVASTTSAGAQYFGRNKVQYEKFDWKILRSDHFDNFFYPSESLIVHDAGRMAERWYTRHSDTFRHAFDRKSLIFYADHPDFEQTNVIGEQLGEETGGVTEGLRTRVIMPFTGIYSDNDHVLGHELVHVFQYNIAEGAPQGGLARLNALPGWLIEGMAEYFSLGRNDPLTAMWMRDAVMRNKFPTIKQLTTDPRFFPYRYGQALWAYVGGKWGDRAIVDVYRTALRVGWDAALVRVLGINDDSLSKEWAAANRAMYLPQIAGRTKPDSEGKTIIGLGRKLSEQQNVSPSVSPDGNYLAFGSRRNC